MGKYYVIANKTTGQIDDCPGAGLYYTSDSTDLGSILVDDNCFLKEITQEAYGELQKCGFEIERSGKTMYVDRMEDILETDTIKCGCMMNKVDHVKAKRARTEKGDISIIRSRQKRDK